MEAEDDLLPGGLNERNLIRRAKYSSTNERIKGVLCLRPHRRRARTTEARFLCVSFRKKGFLPFFSFSTHHTEAAEESKQSLQRCP